MPDLAQTPSSFAADDRPVAQAAGGQIAHREAIAHGALFEPRLWACGPHAWCMVGNGLSNQVFVEGPDGLIAIDTGESVEEMAAALKALRQVSQRPVVAVIYTHFHYVGGTAALKADAPSQGQDWPIWAHARVPINRQRMAGEFSAVGERGIVHQFGLLLPAQGEDAMLHAGIGPAFRNPAHAPFTPGHWPPTQLFNSPTKAQIAGLEVHLQPAPSDSDDSVSLWFPSLGLAVNNLMWPALFNVYPIRGEPYRDPTVLMDGLDHLRGLPVDHLLATHGTPLAGRERILDALTVYRDAIQYLWDQTVRGLNQGLTGSEIAHRVPLPVHWGQTHFTRQAYGLMEHHLRQIRSGLVGWFDGDESTLFALPTGERAARLVHGFGGREVVREQASAALKGHDLRWALELASWLVRAEPDSPAGAAVGPAQHADRQLMAHVLRQMAQRTTAQNIRNWCLTRALDLEGRIDLQRFYRHRFRMAELQGQSAASVLPVLRVLLVPERAVGVDDELGFDFDDGSSGGLHVRHQVAVPTDGTGARLRLALPAANWRECLVGRQNLKAAMDQGQLRLQGELPRIQQLLACLDLPGLAL